MASDPQVLSKAFADQLYKWFDGNRSLLGNLYVDCSILQFENDLFVGKEKIMNKLTSLPFTVCKHVLTTVDGQPTVDGGILVHVVGQLKTDDDQPHTFSEAFHLKAANGSWLILNDFFGLGLHNG